MNEEYTHPTILPKKSQAGKWGHLKATHCGRSITMNEIRDRGFWIINVSSITKPAVFICVACHKLRGRMEVQIMADLPIGSFKEEAPFTYHAVNMFGPLQLKVK